jgi:hypothetical protein
VVILRANGESVRVGVIAQGADGRPIVRLSKGPASSVGLADLFPTEGDARDEFARRRAATYRRDDRRCRIDPVASGAAA